MTGDQGFPEGTLLCSVVSIHARRVTGDSTPTRSPPRSTVSIHARRVTGDPMGGEFRFIDRVSIHARRVTGDLEWFKTTLTGSFQFTPVV